MKRTFIGVIVSILLLSAVGAGEAGPNWLADGWGDCNPSGNYGGDNYCWVAWEPACSEGQRDAYFVVGEAGKKTTMILIDHLDSIAPVVDSFEVLDGEDVICSWYDTMPGSTEQWVETACPVDLDGVKLLTIRPLAAFPWDECGTYGQVAVRHIEFTAQNQIPEFTVVGALVGLAAVAGLFVMMRKN